MTTPSRESPVSSSGPPLAGGDLRPSPGNSPQSDVVGGVPNAMPQPREWSGVALSAMKIVSEERAGVGQRGNRKVQSENRPATRVTDHEGVSAIVNCQLSIVSCQLPAVSCQLSVVSCQLSVISCQLLVSSC